MLAILPVPTYQSLADCAFIPKVQIIPNASIKETLDYLADYVTLIEDLRGVDAAEAICTGVILYPGDTYSLEINNLNLIYIDSAEVGEGVRYTYFT